MPEIVEKAESTFGRKLGPLPVYGWAAIAVGTIVVVKLIGGKSGGSSTITVPDAFPGGADGTGDTSGGGTTVPASGPPAGSGSTGTVKPLTVTITSKTGLYDASHRLTSFLTKATVTVTKGPSHGGGWYWYKITSGTHAGHWIIAKPGTGGKLVVKPA